MYNNDIKILDWRLGSENRSGGTCTKENIIIFTFLYILVKYCFKEKIDCNPQNSVQDSRDERH